MRKCKRPAGSGLWGAYEVSQDRYGVWLYTPEGSSFLGTDRDGRVGECFAGQPDAPGLHVLQLVPSAGAWWYAHWKHYKGQRQFAIDICTPAVIEDNEWSYVDLELDLIKWSPGEPVVLDDEDEFEEAVDLGHITQEERQECLATTRDLQRRLGTRDSLFDELAWSRLAEVVALRLPPITRIA